MTGGEREMRSWECVHAAGTLVYTVHVVSFHETDLKNSRRF